MINFDYEGKYQTLAKELDYLTAGFENITDLREFVNTLKRCVLIQKEMSQIIITRLDLLEKKVDANHHSQFDTLKTLFI